jgi:hypothetical protein
MRQRVLTLLAAGIGIALAASAEDKKEGWLQWGQGPQHTSSVVVVGQPARRVLQDIVYDPFSHQIRTDPLGNGGLRVHYQVPLVDDDDDVFIEVKTGTFTGIQHWETQIWNERHLRWNDGALETVWNFESDWKPVPYSFSGRGPFFEPVFHGALAGRYLYVPGFGGTIFKLTKRHGAVVARINPFGSTLDPARFVSGPLTVDPSGTVYYHVIKLDLTSPTPWDVDVVDSWLVKVASDGSTQMVGYPALVPDASQGNNCLGVFSGLPQPPSPDAVPPLVTCGKQRPGLNHAIAVAPDGTLYTMSVAHLTDRYGYLVAVNPDLTPKWAASLRDRFNDGCNVLIPRTGTPGGCRTGARDGVDPAQNRPGGGRVRDSSTSSPTVLPDGSVLYGAFTRYNYSQGQLMKFGADGEFLASYPYGWDVTPSIWEHDGTYSIIIKENRYGVGSYCGTAAFCPPDRTANHPAYPEGYFITQLSPDLVPEWQHQNTSTQSCTRNPDGTITCVSDHPHGFEWCINAAAVDRHGSVYANSEDGGLYVIRQGGTIKDYLFLNGAQRAAYTPLSIGVDGKIYTQSDGHLFVVGRR